MTRYRHFYLPGGTVLSVPDPGSPLTFGTYVAPTRFLPIRSREEIEADERREAAGKALAVLREARPGDFRRMTGQPCGACVLGPVPRLLPLGFPFPPAGA